MSSSMKNDKEIATIEVNFMDQSGEVVYSVSHSDMRNMFTLQEALRQIVLVLGQLSKRFRNE